MVNTVDPLLVSINDATKILSLGRSKFYQLVSEGKIPIVKLGRRSLVSVTSLKKFADSLSGTST